MKYKYKYIVHFEGITEVISNEKLSEEEIFDKIYLWKKINSHIEEFELLDEEEIEE